MKIQRLLLAAAAFAVASLAQAATDDIPAPVGDVPVQCLLHFTAALPGETRFGDDGSTTLAWEDSLGRRSQARIAANGGLVLTLPDGGIREYPPEPRLPTHEELLRLDGVVAAYWAQGVDLVGRRMLSPQQAQVRPPDEPEKVWDNAEGVWLLIDACDKAERQSRNNCQWDCAEEGMSNIYRPGQCGAGSSCTCVYEVSRQPDF